MTDSPAKPDSLATMLARSHDWERSPAAIDGRLRALAWTGLAGTAASTAYFVWADDLAPGALRDWPIVGGTLGRVLETLLLAGFRGVALGVGVATCLLLAVMSALTGGFRFAGKRLQTGLLAVSGIGLFLLLPALLAIAAVVLATVVLVVVGLVLAALIAGAVLVLLSGLSEL